MQRLRRHARVGVLVFLRGSWVGDMVNGMLGRELTRTHVRIHVSFNHATPGPNKPPPHARTLVKSTAVLNIWPKLALICLGA